MKESKTSFIENHNFLINNLNNSIENDKSKNNDKNLNNIPNDR